ncbi:MAG: MotA/TolQ/ExbB proton channel family protein [Polaromonas sp.]|uniref:MotA/TolQ/ExbB proton channel family protein n=1 Tax=Polaromonas sp. TaxID=1869339 RepID=UPI0018523D86|nr:MotA/TolQ/ExbB proton channel family protein [Polaromonas sp.]MBA3593621.1 MotA/TolQ/ExbB proton channel family protein [Polaromonas sp.]
MPFENALFQLAQMFLWPVTLLVFAVFAYAVMSLGAFGVEWLRRRRQPDRLLLLNRLSDASAEALELAVLKELEGLRLCSRVAPMLGLVATMIPMGPALVAVASGQSQGVAQNLAPAFAAVIVALVAASITFVVYSVRRRWLLAEMLAVLDGQTA